MPEKVLWEEAQYLKRHRILVYNSREMHRVIELEDQWQDELSPLARVQYHTSHLCTNL